MINTKNNSFLTNIFLIILGYVVPIAIIKLNQNNYKTIYIIQLIALLVILAAGIVLTYINNKNTKVYPNSKMTFIIFEILGIVGIFYSLYPLYLIYAFRNGIGF
jgi:cytochrome bd-type quinol oxidase subunit 2